MPIRRCLLPLCGILVACGSGPNPIHGTPLDASTPTVGDGAVVSDGSSPSTTDAAVDPGKPSCKYVAHQTGLHAYQQSGGLAFHVYAPSTYNPAVAHTLIVLMHGQDSDGTPELDALWRPIADAEQLVVLVPKGSRPPTDPTNYPNGANWTVNDLNVLQYLISDIDDCYSVDPKRHILWGFSEGGFYGYLLGIGAALQFSGLAMGGANTSFARSNGYPPSAAPWHIPVSHVQGTSDPNGTAQSVQDKSDFEAAGSVFKLYLPMQGHTITQAQVQQQYDDLKTSRAP